MNKHFIGIDLSISNTGLIVLNKSNKILLEENIKSDINDWREHKKAPENVEGRLIHITNNILSAMLPYKKESIINLEGLSLGSKGMRLAQIGGLHYYLRIRMYKKKLDFIITPPKTLKKFVTGKGNSPKEVMLVKTLKKFKVEFEDNNLCDAYGLARMLTTK